MGRSLLDDITREASRQRRTISQQICWLAGIALSASCLSMKTEDGFVDDTKGRVYVYMEPALDVRVTEARGRMGESVSYSACVRALVMAGVAMQRRSGLCGRGRIDERVVLMG